MGAAADAGGIAVNAPYSPQNSDGTLDDNDPEVRKRKAMEANTVMFDRSASPEARAKARDYLSGIARYRAKAPTP